MHTEDSTERDRAKEIFTRAGAEDSSYTEEASVGMSKLKAEKFHSQEEPLSINDLRNGKFTKIVGNKGRAIRF